MATDLVYRISAIDNASKVAQRVQGSFSKIASPLDKITRGLVDSGRGTVALARVATGMRTVADVAKAASDRIASIVPGMSALVGVMGGAGGIAVLAERWGNLGFHLQTTSRMLGVSARGLQAWHFAAQRAGVTAEQFDQSMVSSQNTIRQAAFGANPQAMMLMNRLGVNISRTKSGDIDYQKTQQDLLQALGRVRNPVGQRTAAEALGMGALVPMIQRGTYNADRRTAIADGYAPSNDAIQRATEFRDIMFGFNTQISDLGNTIGGMLVPVLTPMVQKFSTWLNSHRLAIAQSLGDAVKRFTDWISSVNWDGLFDKVNKVVDKFGGWGDVLGGIVAIKFASVLAGWMKPLTDLAGKLLAAKGAADALKKTAGVAGAAAGGGFLAGVGGVLASAGRFLISPAGIVGVTSLARLGGALYSPNLNTGEQKTLDAIRAKGGGSTIGIRSNNPLNIRRNNVERTYSTPEEGIAAGVSLLRRKYRGLTLAQITDKWTGGARTGNSAAASRNYTSLISKASGINADQVPDLNDPTVITGIIKGQIRAENGDQPYTDEQIASGVKAGLSGASPASPAVQAAGGSDPDGWGSRHTQALERNIEATNLLTQALRDRGLVGPSGEGYRNGDGNPYLPTRVNYQILGAMP